MAWLKLDDRFAEHPKIVALSDKAFRVWMRVLSYCARNETDGVIPPCLMETVPAKVLEELLRVLEAFKTGLCERMETGGFQVHDYLDFNPSREKLTRERRRRAIGKRDWRRRKEEELKRLKTAMSTEDGQVDYTEDGSVDYTEDGQVESQRPIGEPPEPVPVPGLKALGTGAPGLMGQDTLNESTGPPGIPADDRAIERPEAGTPQARFWDLGGKTVHAMLRFCEEYPRHPGAAWATALHEAADTSDFWHRLEREPEGAK